MKNKVIFLDIDGTLVGFDGTVPKSTIEALNKAKENGHQIVICSGRSRFQIYPNLLQLGFDGIVGGAGVFVDYHGKEIYHVYIEEENRKWITEYLENYRFVFSMQAEQGIVVNARCKRELVEIYKMYGMEEDRLNRLLGNLEVREDVWNNHKGEKIIYYKAPFPLNQVRKDIAPNFEVVASSFETPDDFSGEISIAGINKATGMKHYLEASGFTQEDTVAIGDGPNDLEMMNFAKISVAMGNAQQSVKDAADLVTSHINEDGIYRAFEQIGLI